LLPRHQQSGATATISPQNQPQAEANLPGCCSLKQASHGRVDGHRLTRTGRRGRRWQCDDRTFFISLRATSRISSLIVAENIMTCFFGGHFTKIFCTTLLMSASLAFRSGMCSASFFAIYWRQQGHHLTILPQHHQKTRQHFINILSDTFSLPYRVSKVSK
jgi:hypothetical protein